MAHRFHRRERRYAPAPGAPHLGSERGNAHSAERVPARPLVGNGRDRFFSRPALAPSIFPNPSEKHSFRARAGLSSGLASAPAAEIHLDSGPIPCPSEGGSVASRGPSPVGRGGLVTGRCSVVESGGEGLEPHPIWRFGQLDSGGLGRLEVRGGGLLRADGLRVVLVDGLFPPNGPEMVMLL